MDLSDANQSCYNKDFKNVFQKPVSKNAPIETSDKIDTKSINDDELTLTSESCKIVTDVWHSFNAFQRTNTDAYEKDKVINSASYDQTSVIVKSPNSCTQNTTTKPISSISETPSTYKSFIVSKMAYSKPSTLCNLALLTKLNPGISASKTSTSSSLSTLSSSKPGVSPFKTDFESLLESNKPSSSTESSNSTLKCTIETVPSVTNNVGTSSNPLPDTPHPTIHVLLEHNDKDVKSSGIIPTQSLPLTEPSTFRTTVSPDLENFPNLKPDKHRGLRGIFSEDDDWDIYQPTITTAESIPITESSLESDFILGRLRWKTEKCLSKNNLISVIDYDTHQRTSPYIPPSTGSFLSSSLVNKGSTFPEYNEDKMLKEVKAYFLENPIRVTGSISNLECKKWIISAPYFSKNFALTHGLALPKTTLIQEPNLLEELKKVNKPTQNQELVNDVYEKYLRVRLINDKLREQFIKIRSKFLSQNQADSTSDVISVDILVSPTYADNTSCPRTTNQAHVIKPTDLNTSNSISHNADCEIKSLANILKTYDSLTSIKSNDILGAGLNKPQFLLQSSNEDKNEMQSSFNSFHVHSGKSNDSLDTTTNVLPHIRDSNEQNDKQNSTTVHSRKSSNPQNKASYSNTFILQSFEQHVTENSRKRQAEKLYEVLENASNTAICIRKFYQDDEESRKKIRLQENANICQME